MDSPKAFRIESNRIRKPARSFALCIAICIGLVFLSGCDPDYVGGTPNPEVVGKVFLDGQPVQGARVTFIPLKYTSTDGRTQHLSFGITDESGEFSLKRADGEPGGTAGMNRVLISKRTPVSEADIQKIVDGEPVPKISPTETVAAAMGVDGQPGGEMIPALYNIRSVLTYEVDSQLGRVRPEFQLTTIDPVLLEKDE